MVAMISTTTKKNPHGHRGQERETGSLALRGGGNLALPNNKA